MGANEDTKACLYKINKKKQAEKTGNIRISQHREKICQLLKNTIGKGMHSTQDIKLLTINLRLENNIIFLTTIFSRVYKQYY